MMFSLTHFLVFFAYVWAHSEAATIATDKPKVDGWSNAFSNESSLIPLVNFGEKSYYFGVYFTATFLEADQFCRDIHMELVRVQSAEENDKLYKYVQESTKQDHFWTAGSTLVDKKNWIWLTTGEVVEYTNWGVGQPDNPNSELCLELWLFRNKGLYFNDRDCNVRFPFICEKDKRKHDKPQGGSDSDWATIFQNPSVSPNVNLLHFEGKSYYFGTNFRATYLQATQFCQIINMKLVSITSEAENNRLHKYIRDTSAGNNFWSSGSRAIDGKTWVWLSSGRKVDYTNWLPGQPDNVNDLCIELIHQKENGLFWNDLNCIVQLYFICERNDVVIPLLPPLGPGPVLPTQPPHTTEPTVPYPDNPSLPLVNTNRGSYRISKTKATQEQASQTCKKYGMELINIASKKENDEVISWIRQSGQSGSGDNYWTSGKKQADGKWVWWNQQPLTYTNWAKGEPNNANNNESCLELYPTGHWNDVNCDNDLYFICEHFNSGGSQRCESQPVVNIYVNNNHCSTEKNGTVTETKRIASSENGEGYNVEINNNIETRTSCPKPHK